MRRGRGGAPGGVCDRGGPRGPGPGPPGAGGAARKAGGGGRPPPPAARGGWPVKGCGGAGCWGRVGRGGCVGWFVCGGPRGGGGGARVSWRWAGAPSWGGC